jgi:hypothetical protein
MTLTKEAIAEITSAVAKNNNCFDPDEYQRLPKLGSGGRVYGLSRSTLLEIGQRCPGLILTLRQPRAERGINLLHVPTLRNYLESLRKGQQEVAK